jgi:orotidine-5'-phosphate decarboxylase
MYDRSGEYAGSEALTDVLEIMSTYGDATIILDVKDADIARSSAAYAISKLKLDHVDAITVHPYMGTDSVEPFFQLAHERGQGVYVLTRTTNPGAEDFQELPFSSSKESSGNESKKLYNMVAEKVVEWSESYPGTVGSVMAGNNPAETREIAEFYAQQDTDIPILIPGVGTQGGTASEVMEALDAADFDHRLARINSSSGIMYRAQKDGKDKIKHGIAGREEVNRLNKEIEMESYL